MGDLKEHMESRGRRGGTRQECDDRDGVAEWARARLGAPVDALQARVLETATKRGILNCSRQWGYRCCCNAGCCGSRQDCRKGRNW
jgi:hypothetical protein